VDFSRTEVLTPATGLRLAQVQAGNAQDIHRAVRAASRRLTQVPGRCCHRPSARLSCEFERSDCQRREEIAYLERWITHAIHLGNSCSPFGCGEPSTIPRGGAENRRPNSHVGQPDTHAYTVKRSHVGVVGGDYALELSIL